MKAFIRDGWTGGIGLRRIAAFFLPLTVLALGACSRGEYGRDNTQYSPSRSAVQPSMENGAARPGLTTGGEAEEPAVEEAPPDNTVVNKRDSDDQSLTPMDQSENEFDRKLTQQIRQAIVGEETLSTNAKNIKIITVNGVVTLRGPVESPEEKQRIEQIAAQIAGGQKVVNQLDVDVQ